MLREVDGFVLVSLVHEAANLKHDDKPLYLDDISEYVDGIADQLWPVNIKVHDNPELGFEEFIAHATLTAFFKAQAGWKVTPSAYGMATAWVAEWDSGKKGPVISYNVEMGKSSGTNGSDNLLIDTDALEGIGHACGHNLIMTASVSGGLATAKMIAKHDLGGKVVVFGTPAEEGQFRE